MSLTRSELADIFLGKKESLSDGVSVVPVDQPEGQPVRKQFYDRYLDRSLAQVKTYWSKLIFTGRGRPPRTVPGRLTAADYIAENPYTIGYIDKDEVDERLRVIPIE